MSDYDEDYDIEEEFDEFDEDDWKDPHIYDEEGRPYPLNWRPRKIGDYGNAKGR